MHINLDNEYGYLSGWVDQRSCIIMSLKIYPEHLNQGHAINLIKEFLLEVRQLGAVHVELEDCSDHYRSDHNIYLKCGFQYKGSDCTMYANIRNSLHAIQSI